MQNMANGIRYQTTGNGAVACRQCIVGKDKSGGSVEVVGHHLIHDIALQDAPVFAAAKYTNAGSIGSSATAVSRGDQDEVAHSVSTPFYSDMRSPSSSTNPVTVNGVISMIAAQRSDWYSVATKRLSGNLRTIQSWQATRATFISEI